jgi:SAM-dependent methyltransferase
MADPQPSVAPAPEAFRFGRNWQRYVARHLSDERIDVARRSLVDLLDDDIAGRSFLDIGSGSGLFSLCAHLLGASRVVSVDVDPDSVASTSALRAGAGDPASWSVLEGSILDRELVQRLEPADIVYSWGVLHHTGDMYAAITEATSLVAPGGRFAIGIYNRATAGPLPSHRWLRIKRAYNRSPRPVQVAMEMLQLAYWAQGTLRAGRNPVREARAYKRERGMAMRTDVIDWLGGYPYEYATAGEIVSFCESQLGLTARKVKELDPRGTGNNEFLFER